MTALAPLFTVRLYVEGKKHWYLIADDETGKPSVTGILSAAIPKPAFVPWALNSMGDNVRDAILERVKNNVPISKEEIDAIILEGKNIYKKKSADAADIGTRVHAAIDQIIHGKEPEMTPDIKPAIDSFLSWQDENKIKIELGDTKIGSRLFGYGGSLDFVGFHNGEPVIFDIKTTKKRKDKPHGVYDEYALQLAAYRNAFKETYGLTAESCQILWINKEKVEFKAVQVGNINAAFEGFLACLKLYNLQKYEMFEETNQ
jgi:hypothetical protein